MARPTKYTPETVKKILDALAAGNTRKASALYAGIGENTLGDWLNRYRDFRDAVENAEARAEVGHVLNIRQAAQSGTWTASAWWLERRRHQEWGRKDRIEIINSVRELARAAGQDEDAAVAEAERFLKEMRGARAGG
jgi:hypothetical protein